jgi:hypothetical protein
MIKEAHAETNNIATMIESKAIAQGLLLPNGIGAHTNIIINRKNVTLSMTLPIFFII